MLDSAIKFGGGRYRQGRGLLEECGREIGRFGRKVFILAGPRAWEAVKERLLPGLGEAGVDYAAVIYEGSCSYEAAEEYDLKAFMSRMGMPLSLEETGINATEENLDILEAYLAASPYVEQTEEKRLLLQSGNIT